MGLAFQGFATFSGIPSILNATYTMSSGISPGCALIEFVPFNGTVPSDGTLVFTFGGIVITFPGCHVDQASAVVNDEGLTYRVSIHDRRWAWQFGRISGSYNVRLSDTGTLDPLLKMLPQQLAMLCCLAMGEPNADVSALPNNAYPEVNWENDTPAVALQQLCEEFGCRVVLGLDNRVHIVIAGLSTQILPTLEALTLGPSAAFVERPRAIIVVGGKSRYEVRMPLQAVGMELDGTVQPIRNLSYSPPGGWANHTDPGSWFAVPFTPNQAGQVPLDYAQRTVYRWYQIVNQNPDGSTPLNIPGYGKLSRLLQILPLDDRRTVQGTDFSGALTYLPARVNGSWYDFTISDNHAISDEYVDGESQGWTLNTEKGIIEFDKAIYFLLADDTMVQANMFLTVACSVKDPQTWAYQRGEWTLPTPFPNGVGVRVVRRDEIVYETAGVYASGTQKLKGYQDNSAAVTPEFQYYAQTALAEYQSFKCQHIKVGGIWAGSVDGAIQQITWRVSDVDGTETEISVNTETHPAVPPYRERALFADAKDQMLLRLRKAASKLARQKKPVDRGA